MELISQPETTDELVTDLDLIFLGGTSESLTLRPADQLTVDERSVRVKIAAAGSFPEEDIIYFVRQIIGMKIRKRVVKRPVKKEKM